MSAADLTGTVMVAGKVLNRRSVADLFEDPDNPGEDVTVQERRVVIGRNESGSVAVFVLALDGEDGWANLASGFTEIAEVDA